LAKKNETRYHENKRINTLERAILRELMKKIILVLFVAAAISTFAADSTVKGYLVESVLCRGSRQLPGWGAKHTTMCLPMPDCAKSGYGVLTDDKKTR
jgi:hypothetical protein